jgi:hypothetical protein
MPLALRLTDMLGPTFHEEALRSLFDDFESAMSQNLLNE